MSDRAACQVIVHSCPKYQRGALMKAIEDAFEFGPWDENPSREGGELVLGERYGAEEMSLGAYDWVSDDLEKAAPGAAFTCWSDPKYEYDGGMTMRHPKLGRWTGGCDSMGNPHLDVRVVKDMLTAHPGGLDDPQFLKESGIAWLEKFEEARA